MKTVENYFVKLIISVIVNYFKTLSWNYDKCKIKSNTGCESKHISAISANDSGDVVPMTSTPDVISTSQVMEC